MHQADALTFQQNSAKRLLRVRLDVDLDCLFKYQVHPLVEPSDDSLESCVGHINNIDFDLHSLLHELEDVLDGAEDVVLVFVACHTVVV